MAQQEPEEVVDVCTPNLNSKAKRIGSKKFRGYEDEALCAICAEGDWEDDNLMIFCDGCDVAVHQVCYGGGARMIPDGSWFCEKCLATRRGRKGKVECVLCPLKEGVMKRTVDWRWAHIVCALWIPGVKFVDPEGREPIDLSGINEKRSELICCICETSVGACIQCKERRCLRAFHVTCARNKGFQMVEKEKNDWVDFFAYCDKHTPCQGPRKKRKRKQEKW